MIKKIRALLQNYLHAGLDIAKTDPQYHVLLMTTTLLAVVMSAFTLLSFVSYFLTHQNTVLYIDLLGLFLTAAVNIYLYRSKNITFSAHFLILTVLVMSNFVFYVNGVNNFTFVWALLLPVFAFLLTGIRFGLLYSAVHLTSMASIGYFGLGVWEPVEYQAGAYARIVLSIFLFSIFILFYEWSRQLSATALDRSLKREQKQALLLQKSIDELNTYKESLEERIEKAVHDKEIGIKLLAQQSKMATIGEMMAAISHQWKQPLNNVAILNGSIKIDLLMDNIQHEKLEDSITKIETQIEHMNQTLSDFNNFFRPNKKAVIFNVQQAFEETFILFNPLFKSNHIQFTLQGERSLVALGYANEFKHVILNIVTPN
jgi:signal transduction histidine kinase